MAKRKKRVKKVKYDEDKLTFAAMVLVSIIAIIGILSLSEQIDSNRITGAAVQSPEVTLGVGGKANLDLDGDNVPDVEVFLYSVNGNSARIIVNEYEPDLCGDGICQASENSQTCAQDCYCSSCASGKLLTKIKNLPNTLPK